MIRPRLSLSRTAALAGLAIGFASVVAGAQAAEPWTPAASKATQSLVVDGETGAILFEKNSAKAFPPASLAKIMTMEVVFEALRTRKVRLDQPFPVSEHAWRTGGAPSGTSTMFAKVRSSIPLDALIRGTIVQAANDAAIVIAEGMAGSESAFAGLMNARARELGMTGSVFANPTGLPASGQSVTARDLVVLARHVEGAHKDFYRLYAEPEFQWNEITQRNRNPLLRLNLGATGMSTGFTEAGGYSIVGVTEREGRKTFLVLGGLPSVKDREDEARRVIEWANSTFDRKVLFAAGTTVGRAAIYGGLVPEIVAVAREDVVALVPRDGPEKVKARVIYDWPLSAPLAAGDRVGRMEVLIGDTVTLSRDVFAADAVEQGSFAARALDAAQELAFGWIRSL